MIFSPADLARIKDRRKTQHRLPVDGKCPVHEGRVYRACSRNAGWTASDLQEHRQWAQDEFPNRARALVAFLSEPLEAALLAPAPTDITIMDVQCSTLGAVSQQDAQREGFRFLSQYQNRWASTHGVWDPEMAVWVISFEVGDHRDRFDQFRLLKATPGRTSEVGEVEEHQDYTSRLHLSMRGSADPGEGVDARTLERFAAEGLAGHAKRRQVELRRQHARSLSIRLRDALRREDADEIAVVVRELERVEQQLRSAA